MPTKNTARHPYRGSTIATTIAASAVADRPAALHHAERLAAMLLRPRFADERGAARPLAAHAEAEQDAEHRELPDVLREARRRTVKTE